MISLKEQIEIYGAYHQDSRNKLTHVVGVPLVTFSLFQALAWFRFVLTPTLPITAATFFYIAVMLYYIRLNALIAAIQFPFTLLLFYLADRAALFPAVWSISIFLTAFILGAIIQLVGHAIEGRRPAFADNLSQVLNAPLFLTAETLWYFGLRRELAAQHTAEARTNSA